MKWNWGTGIVVGMGIFMAFILQYVIRVQVGDDYDNELVTENYYQEEINVDANYQATKNANLLGQELDIKHTPEGIVVNFPQSFHASDIKGTISLYRPSDQSLDHTIEIQSLSSNYLLIPNDDLVSGRWDISVKFSYDGKEYLKKYLINI